MIMLISRGRTVWRDVIYLIPKDTSKVPQPKKKATSLFVLLGLHEEAENEIAQPYKAPVIYTSTTSMLKQEIDDHEKSETKQHKGKGHEDDCVEGCDIPDPTRFIKGLTQLIYCQALVQVQVQALVPASPQVEYKSPKKEKRRIWTLG